MTHGLNWIGILFSKQLSSNDQSSLSSYLSLDSSETQDCVRHADISRDEQTHVAANTLVCESLGLKSDKTLNNLRRATVAWVLQSLKGENDNKHLSGTSGLIVQILSTQEEKQKVY